QLATAGWPVERYLVSSLDEALKSGRTFVTDDADALITHPALEVIIEATGDPKTGICFCLRAIENGKHIVMVNVEADAVAGPLLAHKARQAGVVYSLARGDQPAVISEQGDRARAAGLCVVAGGQGKRLPPPHHQPTPRTLRADLDP